MDSIALALPIASSIAGVISLVVVYKMIRPYFKVTVNCWFCCKNDVVPYKYRNSWRCANCEQYNGFTQDGDYNCTIAGMYVDDTAKPLNTVSYSELRAELSQSHSVLCSNCNQNQQIKIRQLANFVPINECNYDAEVEAYQHHLEQVYRLCSSCEMNVHEQLRLQDRTFQCDMYNTRLTHNTSQLTDTIQRSESSVCRALVLTFLQLCIVVCALLLSAAMLDAVYVSTRWPSVIALSLRSVRVAVDLIATAGMFLQLTSVKLTPAYRLTYVDVLTCFSWLLTMLVCLWLTSDKYLTTRCVACCVVAVMSVVSLLHSCYMACQSNNRHCTNSPTVNRPRVNSVAPDITPVTVRHTMVPPVNDTPVNDVPVVDGLETMSLGTRTNTSNIDTGPFGPVTLATCGSDIITGVRHRQSLIAPARFTASPGCKLSHLTSDDIGTSQSLIHAPDVIRTCQWNVQPAGSSHLLFKR